MAKTVWRTLDQSAGFWLLAKVCANETTLSGINGADGFHHRFVIRAVERSGVNESWSSQLDFRFDHEVTIPNIITPNGDEFNQFFHISKIELYTNSELTIMDRWGKKVFQATHYKNDWDGEGLSAGVYFYILDLGAKDKRFKGIVNILR